MPWQMELDTYFWGAQHANVAHALLPTAKASDYNNNAEPQEACTNLRLEHNPII